MKAVMETDATWGPLAEETAGVASAVRTDTIYIVFTTFAETAVAARVAHGLARAMGVPLTVVQFRVRSIVVPEHAPDGIAPEDLEAFVARLRREVGEMTCRTYIGTSERRLIPFALRPHSLVVVAGRRHWWGSQSERLRRLLERAGHFVVFVDAGESKEARRA